MSINKKNKALRFGTSGLRDLVTNMTDKEIYINTVGFLDYLKEKGGLREGSRIALGGDYRSSTERIMGAVAKAITDCRLAVDNCGRIPSPALVCYGLQEGIPSIMVTGSHIPDDRNGVKFAKATGEILKKEEKPILECVRIVRNRIDNAQEERSLFDKYGKFYKQQKLPPVNGNAVDLYINRYLNVFPKDCLAGKKIVVYQHSAVGRDILATIFEGLGASLVTPHESITVSYWDDASGSQISANIDLRSEKFIPVDTEKVTAQTKSVLQYLSKTYQPDFIVSTDGDSDRPLVADEQGHFLPGDQLGYLCLYFLPVKPQETFLALPVSTNDGVIKNLKAAGFTVKLTRIGSPYIVFQMMEAASGNHGRQFKNTIGWEANGGFLLGSPLNINEIRFMALPTRDAILPILTTILLAKKERMAASRLFKTKLFPRYTVSAVIDNNTAGLEHYTADLGQRLIARFLPETPDIVQVSLKDNRFYAEYVQGDTEQIPEDDNLYGNLHKIWEELEMSFNTVQLSGVRSVNFIDGVRIEFSGSTIVYHLRPSGNAPEFRSYVTADTQEEAENIIDKRAELIQSLLRLLD